jgi:HK97 family phage major capsid protein
MNIPQMRADLKAKSEAAKKLMENTMRACQEHVVTPATATAPAVTGRVMTAEEKGAIEALLAEARTVKARLDQVEGDAAMMDEINRMTGHAAAPSAPDGRTSALSIGAQFVADENYRRFIQNGGHRRAGAWTSPTVELHATTLTEGAGSGGPLILPQVLPGIQPLQYRRAVVADLIAPGTTDSPLIQYMKEKTFTNAADAVAEGGLKPESTLVFESATSAVRKIAHWIPVSEEMLEDYAQTASIIDARLRLGLDLKEEDELLNGSGIDPHILGLMTLPGLAAAQARGTDTNIDAIFKQMMAIASAVFLMPDAFVINPINWQAIQLQKNTLGNYLGSGPWAAAQPPTLWGVGGAVTPAIAAGVALVGGFRSAAQIFRRGGVRVESSNSHASFFVNNLVAIRAEERLALAVYREAAFGKVTGLN